MKAVYSILLILPTVSAHGLLFSPIDSKEGTVRGIQKLSTQIDALRNPVIVDASKNEHTGYPQCRGEPKGKAVATSFSGGEYTITMAISKAALHIGDCSVYVTDENMQNSVQIAHSTNMVACALPSGTTAGQYNCEPVPNSSTNDMCLIKWTFKPMNADKIKCKDCVLQWKWTATQNAPNYEHFENCADITVGGSADYQQPPPSGRQPSPKPNREPPTTNPPPENSPPPTHSNEAPGYNAGSNPPPDYGSGSNPPQPRKKKCKKKH